jgi:hypothetical protein
MWVLDSITFNCCYAAEENIERRVYYYTSALSHGPFPAFSVKKPVFLTSFYVLFACRIVKRAKFSRRRPFDSEGDVDYINERNKKFNKKASRFYDQYTTEIKQNLERGTAV